MKLETTNFKTYTYVINYQATIFEKQSFRISYFEFLFFTIYQQLTQIELRLFDSEVRIIFLFNIACHRSALSNQFIQFCGSYCDDI